MSKQVIESSNVCKQFIINGETKDILDNINFSVEEGEFISIVGASGCGKSTMLRIISGLETASSGEIKLENVPVKTPSPDLKVVFQESRLLPWLTVEKNIRFGLDRTVDKKTASDKVQQYIDLVGLSGFEKAYPKELSGGMQQRVSIARSLISDPKVLLLDEPFGALDALTRINMQHEVLKIWEKQKRTMILVTHDIDEAVYLSDRVIVLTERPGKIRNIVEIKLPRPRDRGSDDFNYFKNMIFKEFFKSEETQKPDYYI